jgi:hypothetical protein
MNGGRTVHGLGYCKESYRISDHPWIRIPVCILACARSADFHCVSRFQERKTLPSTAQPNRWDLVPKARPVSNPIFTCLHSSWGIYKNKLCTSFMITLLTSAGPKAATRTLVMDVLWGNQSEREPKSQAVATRGGRSIAPTSRY